MDATMIATIGTLLSNFGFPVIVSGYLIYTIQPQLKALSDAVNQLKAVVETNMTTQSSMMCILDKQNENAVKIAEALMKIDTKLELAK